MKTLISPLQQNCEPHKTTDQGLIPAITASIEDALALLIPVAAATTVVLSAVWIAGLENSDVASAGIWGVGILFLGMAIDNHDPRAFLQLVTGAVLLVLAWLRTTASPDFAIVSGVLVASWVAIGLFKRLRLR